MRRSGLSRPAKASRKAARTDAYRTMAVRGLKDLHQAVRFGAIGVLNTGLDLGLFLVLTRFAHLQPVLANTLSYGAGMVCSFFLNRNWTFRSSAKVASGQFARFLALNVTLLILGNATLAMLLMILPTLLAKLMVVIASFPVSFILSKKLVFDVQPALIRKDGV